MGGIKLRVYDGIALTGFLMLPALFCTELSALVEHNDTAAWLALAVAFAIMLCLFLVVLRLMRRYEGKHIIEVTAAVMGRPIGVLYGLMLAGYFCFFTGVHIRESAEILLIYGFTLTPLYIVAGLIWAGGVAMNFFGGRAIVKSAGLFFIIVVGGIVVIMLLGLARYNADNLVPWLGNGIPAIAQNGAYMASLFDGVMVLLLLAPAFSGVSKIKKSGVWSLCIGAGAYISLCLCFIMMFSPAVGGALTGGVFEMGKSSYYNHFFYRFESFLLFFLIFSSVMQASIGIFIAKESMAQIVENKNIKPAAAVCAILVLLTVFLPGNILELTQIYLPVIRRYSVFFMAGFPLLAWLTGAVGRAFKHEKA